MVRYASLPFANATGIGLAFVSAQVFSAGLLLREPFTMLQWFGTGLVFAGVCCRSRPGSSDPALMTYDAFATTRGRRARRYGRIPAYHFVPKWRNR